MGFVVAVGALKTVCNPAGFKKKFAAKTSIS